VLAGLLLCGSASALVLSNAALRSVASPPSRSPPVRMDDWVQSCTGYDPELLEPLCPEVLGLLRELSLTKNELYKGAGLWEDERAVDAEALAAIDEPQLDALKREVLARVRDGRVPMLGVLLLRDGEVCCSVAAGEASPGQPLTATSLLRFYSMTKPIVSVVTLMLVEEGVLDLDAPVSKYLRCWKDAEVCVVPAGASIDNAEPAADPITVRMLLTHTSGLTYGFISSSDAAAAAYRGGGLELPHALSEHAEQTEPPARSLYDWAARLCSAPLATQPGSAFEYGHSTDLLGVLIEQVSGASLGAVLKSRVFDPLGMHDTSFAIEKEALPRLATCYRASGYGDWRRADYGSYAIDATDETSPWLTGHAQQDVPSGGAGLISTAADYSKFAECLTRGGEYEGVRLLREKTLADACRDHLGPMGAAQAGIVEAAYEGFGLIGGVTLTEGQRRGNLPAGAASGPGTVAWGGAAGTYFFSDPANRLTCVIYTQLLDYGLGAPDLRPALCRSAARLFPELRERLDAAEAARPDALDEEGCLLQGFTG
jgi:CubicO group peptidase (beta-lactamase class C family)